MFCQMKLRQSNYGRPNEKPKSEAALSGLIHVGDDGSISVTDADESNNNFIAAGEATKGDGAHQPFLFIPIAHVLDVAVKDDTELVCLMRVSNVMCRICRL